MKKHDNIALYLYELLLIPLILVFFYFNFMTISWFAEAIGLNFGFYLFDYMVEHMERGKAVDLYYDWCDLSFHGTNPHFIKPLSIALALMLKIVISAESSMGKKNTPKQIICVLLLCLILFTAFIAFPVARNAYYDDIASF